MQLPEAAYYARIAQLVEHDLAKVGVAGASPASRSKKVKIAGITNIKKSCTIHNIDLGGPGGGTGRHVGLKIQWPYNGRAGSSPAPGTESASQFINKSNGILA